MNKIVVKGARQHNLKNVDIEIPAKKLVVITGLSGSGKSTLAFDTLYAEGQRRYVESLSTYARQFLGKMDKPDVDLIEGLSPAIAIEQKTASHNPRSTVGTVTEIYDYLRLLYARAGSIHCYKCGKEITSQSIDQILESVMSLETGTKIIVLAPLLEGQKGTHKALLNKLKKEGFARVKINGELYNIEETPALDKNKKHRIQVVIDRLVIKDEIKKRLADSLELAIDRSGGTVIIEIPKETSLFFSEKAACIECGVGYKPFEPASFSFNSPQGACSECGGLGAASEFDPDLIIPDERLSLRDGAVNLWKSRNSVYFVEFLEALTAFYKTDIYTPFKDLPEKFKNILLYGSNADKIPFKYEKGSRVYTYYKTYEGIIPNFKRRYKETDSGWSRREMEKFMNITPCPKCLGARLSKQSLSVKIGGLNIYQFTNLSVEKEINFVENFQLEGKKKIIAEKIIKEIKERLGFLKDVGLGYLTLSRSASTLSGGESQRIRLATQIGSKLTGVLYVLDEPSIGLHQRDNRRLLSTLFKMRDLGNTVLVVEHDEETMLAADHIIDMGPGAGINGGKVIFTGSPQELIKDEKSLTGLYLSRKKEIKIPEKRRKGNGAKLRLIKASAHNLKNINVNLPLGCFITITGVSGSGKSTLIQTLHKALENGLGNKKTASGINLEEIQGLEYVDKIINIDQSPIGRTPRSNAGTYTGLFTYIRELFAKTPEARMRGYKPGRFSFNIKGGRCESCFGDGIIKIEMHFLPDVYVACDICNGKRYNQETLEIKYKGKNIDDVLNMTVNQAKFFFENILNIRSKLETLQDVGLGYIKIGQPATTLSGGEAQRIKLSKELSKRSTGKTLYMLDEPTTGLHIEDIAKLLEVLNRLTDAGNTVIVIEHNLEVIKSADYIIDLGPEGGDEGGSVVAFGAPEDIAKNRNSYTGQFLKKLFNPIAP
ncbi:MAG: excinuclease ABC subunit UvrA [Deltaproteobacteria bacterium]|nr:excinuclease ABC subunit UvrA [Deltaproteobacteria bacterium]